MLTDKNGKITAVVIGVGGFLGVGEHLVAVPFEKVKFSTEPVVYTGAANAPARCAAELHHDHGRRDARRRPRSPIPGGRTTPSSMPPRTS